MRPFLSALRRKNRSKRPSCSRRPQLEQLETRLVPATPAQIQGAYGFNLISYQSGTTTYSEANGNLGAGQTIAIVEFGSDPTLANDLSVFDKKYALPAPQLTIATPDGAALYGKTWALETSLDVEWAHAIAPGAKILLIQESLNDVSGILDAVSYANKSSGVSVVSMSLGTADIYGESDMDSYFTHTGVTYVASSGDYAGYVEWPSSSQNVVAVGGTVLSMTSKGVYTSEKRWGSSGGGYSYEPEPTYQEGAQQTGDRSTPDVAYDASGLMVYDSSGYSGWMGVGGTSAGAPQIAAMVAIADQGRALNGLSKLSSLQTLTALYSAPKSDFHTITNGTVTSTGLGSPVANLLVNYLVGYGGTGSGSNNSSSSGSSGSGTLASNVTVTSVPGENDSATPVAPVHYLPTSVAPALVFTGDSIQHAGSLPQPLVNSTGASQGNQGALSSAFFSQLADQPDLLTGSFAPADFNFDPGMEWNQGGFGFAGAAMQSGDVTAGDAAPIPGQSAQAALDQANPISLVRNLTNRSSTSSEEDRSSGSWVRQSVVPFLGMMALVGGWFRTDLDSERGETQRPRRTRRTLAD